MNCYRHSAVFMDEEQLVKEVEAFITVDNFIAIAILMAVLRKKTKLASAVKRHFMFNK